MTSCTFIRLFIVQLAVTNVLCTSFNSVTPTWITSPYFKARDQNVINTLTGSDKTPTYTFIFSGTPFAQTPSLAYGIKGYRGNDFMGQEYFQIRRDFLSNSQFKVSIQIFGVTNLRILNVAYLAIDPNFPHHFNSFDNVPLNYSSGNFANISASTNIPTYHTEIVNYTQQAAGRKYTAFQSPLSSNKIMLLMVSLFINAKFKIGNTSYPVQITMNTEILTSDTYSMKVRIHTNTSITKLHFSQIVFNSNDVLSSRIYFLEFSVWDAGTQGGFIEVPFMFQQNFIMGLLDFQMVDGKCGIEYNWNFNTVGGVEGVLLNPSVIDYGDCGLLVQRSSVLYLKTWRCDPPYVYFNLTSNKCQDYCGEYWFENIPTSQCEQCNYACSDCTSASPYDCLQCKATDFRILKSGACVCINGYYDDGTNQCKTCSSKVNDCVNCFYNATYNSKDAATGALKYGCLQCTQTVFQKGFVCEAFKVCAISNNLILNTKTNVCQKCVQTGCILCASATTCTTCNVAGTYFINSTTQTCSLCNQAGCVKCLTLTTCSQCQNNLSYFLKQSTQTCVYCSFGCTACTTTASEPICTQCVSGFLLKNGVCSCPQGMAFDSITKKCVKCHPKCVTCSGLTSLQCTSCNSLQNRILIGGVCQCLPGKYKDSTDQNIFDCEKINKMSCDSGYMFSTINQSCVEICGDGKLYSTDPTKCDDGDNKNGDGCSDDCNVEKDYKCVTDETTKLSKCTFNGTIGLNDVNTNKVNNKNGLIIQVTLEPPNLDIYTSTDWKKQVTVLGANITIQKIEYKNGKLIIKTQYYENLDTKNITIKFSNTSNSTLTGVSLGSSTFNINSEPGFNTKVYSSQVYKQAQISQKVTQVALISSYVSLGSTFVVKGSFNLVFMLSAMQIGFVNLATLPSWNPITQTLTNLKPVMGYNEQKNVQVRTLQAMAQTSTVSALGFQSQFFKNVNTMLIVQYSLMIICLFVYLIQTKHLAFRTAYKIIQKQVLLLIIFNSNNVMFSLSLINTAKILQIAVGGFSVLVIIIQFIHVMVNYKTYYGFKTIFDIYNVRFKTFVIGMLIGRIGCLIAVSMSKTNTVLSAIAVMGIQCALCIFLTVLRPFSGCLLNFTFLFSEYSLLIFSGCSFAFNKFSATVENEKIQSLMAWVQVGSMCFIVFLMILVIIKTIHNDFFSKVTQTAKIHLDQEEKSDKKDVKDRDYIDVEHFNSSEEFYTIKPKNTKK